MHGKQDMPKGTMEAHCQVELRVADVVQNLFRVGRHLLQAAHHRLLRDRPFRLWDELTCACYRARALSAQGEKRALIGNLTMPAYVLRSVL